MLLLIIWSFLSLTSMYCVAYVLVSMVAAGVAVQYLGYTPGIFVVGLFGILILWMYANFWWITGLLLVVGGLVIYFRRSLPRKLMAGFALFFSMATTVLVFSATILVNIKLDKNKWTSSLTYCAAFFPVSIFAMMQFSLYVTMKGCVVTVFRKLKKIVPRFLLKHIKRSKRNRL